MLEGAGALGGSLGSSMGGSMDSPPPRWVFVYGSLMAPSVFCRVVRRVAPPTYQAGRLQGFVRRRVKRAPYPGLIQAPGAQVDGLLVALESPAELEALDRFEGSEYRREAVSVTLSNGDPVAANVYIFQCPERLEAQDWSFDNFVAKDLDVFLDTFG